VGALVVDTIADEVVNIARAWSTARIAQPPSIPTSDAAIIKNLTPKKRSEGLRD
jgi:hypothetical protein